MRKVFFITGTDTGVGKTVLTALLARYLSEHRVRVAAFKPICSGGRTDGRVLRAALDGVLTLDEINPWYFRAALAPTLAAVREKRSVTLAQVLGHIRAGQKDFAVTLLEGAGGLLSPLGKDFHSRNLIVALRAIPIIVATNKLGAVNHLLLTLEALPKDFRAKAKIVLMSPPKKTTATASNAKLLAQFFPPENILTLPWLGQEFSLDVSLNKPAVKRMLAAVVKD